MIRQSQNYFAAAVSAAALNAAAVAAFVVFTMLASTSGFPLQELFGSGNTVTSASSSAPSGDGEAAPSDSLIRSFGSRSAFGTESSGIPPAANTKQINGTDTGPRPFGGGPNGGSAGSTPSGVGGPAGAPGSGSGGSSSGSGIGGVGGIGGAGGGAQLPSTPQQQSAAAQQVGGAISQAPSAVNQGVGNAVDTVDQAVAGGLTQSGVKPTVKGASNSLLGPGSAVNQAANGVGGALQGVTNRVASAPVSVPSVDPGSAPSAVSGAVQGTPLG